LATRLFGRTWDKGVQAQGAEEGISAYQGGDSRGLEDTAQ